MVNYIIHDFQKKNDVLCRGIPHIGAIVAHRCNSYNYTSLDEAVRTQ